MFKKTIKIFPAPHVEVRLHVSKEMVKDFKACCDTGGLGQLCTECSWFNVKIGATTVCCIKGLRKEIRRQIEKNGKEEGKIMFKLGKVLQEKSEEWNKVLKFLKEKKEAC